jgi:hypothetical protein
MNVEIGAGATLFPEKEYIKGIFVAVHTRSTPHTVNVANFWKNFPAKEFHWF